jgi:argininosuccinate lyase
VGAAVALAEKLHKPLDQLTPEEFQSVDRRLDRDVAQVFDLEQAMNRRNLPGAPGRREVARQLMRWQKMLG